MNVVWDHVTRLSQWVAIILFVLIFGLGLFLGRKVGVNATLGKVVNDVTFVCDANQKIHAVFYKHAVHIALTDGREEFLPQAISASGARYARDDESLVFWNKGNTAFVTEGNPSKQTYANCVIK